MKKYTFTVLTLLIVAFGGYAQEDPYLWLEEVDGEQALEYVEKLNAATVEELSAEPDYQSIFDKSLEIYNSKERIEYPRIRGEYVYNFWKDKDHVRGIWRRCSLSSYMQGAPEWDILLDIDALAKADDKKWVYKGATGLYPDYNRFLIQLSDGGGDAVYTKEFNMATKSFIEDGFYIPESKGGASYIDENTLLVSSDFGEGTMTTSGYPNQAKIWKRGTALTDAQLIHEGNHTDVGTWGYVMRDGDKSYAMVTQAQSFYTSTSYVWHNGQIVKLDMPDDASASGILNNQIIVSLKSDWEVNGTTYETGTLVSLDFEALINGDKKISVIMKPDASSSISQVSSTKNKLLLTVMTDVVNELHIYSFVDGVWKSEKVDAPDFGTISVVATDDVSDRYYFTFQNFTTPTTMYAADAATNSFEVYKSLTGYFDASNYEINQFMATSKDGTKVPYFMVSAKGAELDGSHPTLIYAYGGFEVSSQPFYSGTFGTGWLDKGGVFVLANIRGGGEYGPMWHQNGIKENRQNVFDDLYAVSEDLIARKVTAPDHLGVMGGSNGGLLVGVAFTQRPDLYNAIVCQVPLLDMQRFNKLLAGASWMGEYGNPDVPEEWEYISKYSPYHNVKEGVDYPEVFFGTSTRDDRVHPGHARKMAAKMNDMGYKTYYYENTEGGHAGSSTNEQRAKSNALVFSYLMKKLK